ncbi:MAG: LysR substrate-binding domain-containing protein [Paracoccaceae bacterium]
MRYVQLRAFHNVALHGGFPRAAKALNLTQPAISDQVRRLEEEYDILLFNRHRKRVTLTSQGNMLFDITKRLFENENQAHELLAESRALSRGTLRMIADSAHNAIGVLGEFRKRHPGIHITIQSGNSEEVMRALHSYDADIGVLGEVPSTSDVEAVRLYSAPIVAFASQTLGLPDDRPMPLAKIVRYPLVLRERGSLTRQKLEERAAETGLSLDPVIEAEGREAVREIVASGAGVGFVSLAEFGRDDRLRAIAIEDNPMMMVEALICLRERSGGKLIRAFMALAAAMAEADSQAVSG